MFNRLTRRILAVKNPLNIKLSVDSIAKPSVTSPSLFIPHLSQLARCCDLLSMKKSYCTIVPKSTDVEPAENPIEDTDQNSASNDELQSLLRSNPTMEKKYKILELEVEVMRQGGKRVPDNLKPQHWAQLLKHETRSARKRYLDFLFTLEKKKENEKRKKAEASLERERLRESTQEDLSEYRLNKIAMFMRIYDTTMNRFYHSRLMQAMMFGQQLVIDCGYCSHMTQREMTECAKQLAYLFAQNRVHPEPFDLHFCNVDKSTLLMQKFHRIIPTAYDADFPLNVSEKSYTESFDKSKLVYLTPHCNNEMENYDPESVYIIGAIVDKTNSEPLSLARAKKEGLKMAKLPLDKYLLWGSGAGKRLPLNQIVGILTDLKSTRDWKEAFKHVPRRKLEKPIEEFQDGPFDPKQHMKRSPYRPAKTDRKTLDTFNFAARHKKFSNK